MVVKLGEGLADQVVYDVEGEGLFEDDDSLKFVKSMLLFEVGILFHYSEEFTENGQGELIVHVVLINLQLKVPHFLDILNYILTAFFLFLP